MIDGFEAYQQYMAIKLTYAPSTSYDYFTYGGKTTHTKDTFLKRGDRKHFYVLSKRLNGDETDIRDYLFVTLFYDPKAWVGNLLDQKAQERWKSFQRYRNRFEYMFRQDLKELRDWIERNDSDLKKLILFEKGARLLGMLYAEQAPLMLVHGIHKGFHCIDHWKQHENDFNPMLAPLIGRLSIFQNIANIYSQGLTSEQMRDIVKVTILGGES